MPTFIKPLVIHLKRKNDTGQFLQAEMLDTEDRFVTQNDTSSPALQGVAILV